MKGSPWVEGYISYNKEGDRYEFEHHDDGKVQPLLHENFELFEYRQCDGTWAQLKERMVRDLKSEIVEPEISQTYDMGGFLKDGVGLKIRTKADAIVYAIEMAKYSNDAYNQAQKLFDFICKNVKLPETDIMTLDQIHEVVAGIVDMVYRKKEQGKK